MAVASQSHRFLFWQDWIAPAMAPVAGISGLYLVTALIGVWVSPDGSAAWQRFGLLFLGVGLVLLPGLLRQVGRARILHILAFGAAIFASVLAALFSYQVLTGQPLLNLQANAVGGALAILLPLMAGALYWAGQRRAWLAFAVLAMALVASLLGLLLSASRGAWLGLGVGGVAAGLWLWRQEQRNRRRWIDWIGFVGAWLLVAVGFSAIIAAPTAEPIVRLTQAIPGFQSRLSLWQNMVALLGDYPFTGSGLGSTASVYSAYILLIHVPFLSHAHNLYLQMAVEQGIPGLVFFLWLIGLALWRILAVRIPTPTMQIWCPAALASLVALLIHGFLDAELYVSPLAPLLFLPLGLAFAAGARRVPGVGSRTNNRRLRLLQPAALVLLFGLTAVALLILPSSRAGYEANRGAVAQTRFELGLYRWPEWPVQDAVRRAYPERLQAALQHYQAALALDPANATANRRLGQIALSLGDYTSAQKHLETAHGSTPGHRAVRQLLGESYAIVGEPETAAALWQTLDLSLDQLALRRWWYNDMGEIEHVESMLAAERLMAD